ncbi:MAG: NTP transferase domain-containing protein [Clostridia bacterium]|nr:NTP transferase domain-containing protein [Clostridia bacterium]
MQAIILCGGEQSRLVTLSESTPKAMLPIWNRPLLFYTLEWLKSHDIRDITVATDAESDGIRSFFGDGSAFGVRLRYLMEKEPKKSASAIKQAEWLLDEPFLVVSGNILTDTDLSAAIKKHQSTDADATVFVTKADNPTTSQSIVSGPDGRILSVTDRPDWDEVVTDCVCAGVSIINPKLFSLIPPHRPYELCDLFSDMLTLGLPLYAHPAKGYLKTIDTKEDYLACHRELLGGQCSLPSCRKLPDSGILIGNNCQVHPTAELSPFCVLGDHCKVGAGSKLSDCIVFPGASIPENSRLTESVITGEAINTPDTPLTSNPLCGILYQDIRPDFLLRLSAAFASALGNSAKIALAFGDTPKEMPAKFAMLAGLSAAGAKTYHLLGSPCPSLTKFTLRHLALDGAICVHSECDMMSIELLSKDGTPIDKSTLRATQNALASGKNLFVPRDKILPPVNTEAMTDHYIKDIALHTTVKRLDFTVLVCTDSPALRDTFQKLGSLLGIVFIFVNDASMLSDFVCRKSPDFAFEIKADGSFRLYDDNATAVSTDMYYALVTLICLSAVHSACIYLPTESSETVNHVARALGGSIIRKNKNYWEAELLSKDEPAARLTHALCFDCIRAAVHLCEFLYLNNCSLSEVLYLLPSMHKIRRYVACPPEKKGRVMRRLSEIFNGSTYESNGGITLHKNGNRLFIRPDRTNAKIHIISENPSAPFAIEAAEEFCVTLEKLVKEE